MKKSIMAKPLLLCTLLISLTAPVNAADKATDAAVNQPNSKTRFQNVVARVNGTPIYAREFKRTQKILLAGKPITAIPADKQKDFENHVLNQLISTELLYQLSSKQETKDLDKQIDSKVAITKKRFKNEQDFEKAMSALDMSPQDVRDYARREVMITNFVQSSIVAKLSVSEDESRKFYDQNIERFKQSEAVKASHILISVADKATAEERKAAREKAGKLRKEIAGGADFAALAKSSSSCPSSKQGGNLDYFIKGQMVPAFEQAAFALKVGEVSDVVETRFGYHIIKVTDRKKAETIPFKEARPWIEERLKKMKTSAAVQALVEKSRKESKIEKLTP